MNDSGHARAAVQPGANLRAHRWFSASALACLAVFGWLVTFGTFHFFEEDVFGSFYDHQAAAWLQGRWDVPEPALSGEAFIVGGKVYGYFGPTPALMRVPLVMAGFGFARVTRVFMLLDYAACLAGAYALLLLAARWRDNGAAPTSWVVVLFTTTVGLGSTLFFLGSRAYVYHEAIMCGAAFALWSTFCALRFLQQPTSRWWIGALACGVLAVQARAPIGLFALSLLGCVAVALALPRSGTASRSETEPKAAPLPTRGKLLLIAALSAFGVFSFNLVSYIKFGTFEGCPLRYNVQYTPEKLALLGNRNFHPGNLRFNTDAYFLRPSFSLSAHFPYIYREYLDRRKYPESRMAYRDPTLAMPWSMPGLFALAVGGSIFAAASFPALRQPLRVLWIAALPAALAMLTAVAVTQRYTADFLACLITAAAFGIVSLDLRSGRVRALTLGTITGLTILGIGITLALTLHHQREIVWGVPDNVQQEYRRWRNSVDRVFGVEQRR
jgi:hypothetical protein